MGKIFIPIKTGVSLVSGKELEMKELVGLLKQGTTAALMAAIVNTILGVIKTVSVLHTFTFFSNFFGASYCINRADHAFNLFPFRFQKWRQR